MFESISKFEFLPRARAFPFIVTVHRTTAEWTEGPDTDAAKVVGANQFFPITIKQLAEQLAAIDGVTQVTITDHRGNGGSFSRSS